MSFIKKHGINFGIIAGFAVFAAYSYCTDYLPGKEILQDHFKIFASELITMLPLMFVLIGLFDVWLPKEQVQKHIGSGSGIKGVLLVSLLAFMQAGPLYAAFPVAFMLWKKGCSRFNVFIYLGAFSTMKIPMLMFEIGFLGAKFSLLRILLTIPAIIAIALIMEVYFARRSFEIKDHKY